MTATSTLAKKFLDTSRFHEEANMEYKVPITLFNPIEGTVVRKDIDGEETLEKTYDIDFTTEEAKKVIIHFINHHEQNQVPRLQELARYHNADNNIKYRPGKLDPYRADNRIASDFAHFVTAFNSGVLISNPVQYNVPTVDDTQNKPYKISESASEAVDEHLEAFTRTSDEPYHNKILVNEAIKLGRAYEVVYRNSYGEETVKKLPTEETFVIYDDSMDDNSICAVRYRHVTLLDSETTTFVEIYSSDGLVYFLRADGGTLTTDSLLLDDNRSNNPEDQLFNGCQVTEFRVNEERRSIYESVLDAIDAYDLSQSELANFQQDSNDAYLVIKGNPFTGKVAPNVEGNMVAKDPAEIIAAFRQASMIVLDDPEVGLNGERIGAEPDAYYLEKKYDSEGSEKYKSRLVADILRFTFVVDFTAEQSLGSNESGVGMRFRGWGNDNQRKTMEQLIAKGLKRRLRLLSSSWSLATWLSNDLAGDYDDLYEVVNLITIRFTPNVPKSDTEVAALINNLSNTVSKQTQYQLAEEITSVPSDVEAQRKRDEIEEAMDQTFGLGFNTPTAPATEGKDSTQTQPAKSIVEEGRGE